MSGPALDAALFEATAQLSAAGIEAPRREARILLAAALGTDLAGVLRRRGSALSAMEAARFAAMAARRVGRVPIAQILGRREFWSLDIRVTAATLTPRPDSETMIEMALDLRPARGEVRRVLDLGTGSGCLLLAALSEYPDAFGIGVDLAPATASVAAANLCRLGFTGRAAILVGAWDAALDLRGAGGFDLILCNPPYIPSGDIASLMPEVRLHEPRGALDGGADGLDPYRLLFPRLGRLLAPGGLALFEFGVDQDAAVAALAEGAGLRLCGLRADLAGILRIIAVSIP